MPWNFEGVDMTREDSFFIRQANTSDLLNIRALRQATFENPFSQLINAEPTDEGITNDIVFAETHDQTQLFLVAVRLNDGQAINSYNSQEHPRAAGPGYCASHHWVEGREQAPLDYPYHPTGKTTHGPILGFIMLKPFHDDRAGYWRAARLWLLTVGAAELGQKMMDSVSIALIEQVAVRMSRRDNPYTSLIAEFPFREHNPDVALHRDYFLKAGFKQVGLLERVGERDGIPLHVMTCQRMLNREQAPNEQIERGLAAMQ